MKICYKNLDFIYLTKFGNFRDKRTNKQFKISENKCKNCGEYFLQRKDTKQNDYCSYKCLGHAREHKQKIIVERKCVECNKVLPIKEFPKAGRYKGNQYYKYICKSCFKKNNYIYKNPRQNKKINKNKISDDEKVLMKKLNTNFSSLLRNSILDKGGKHWEKLVNYTLEELKNHLENLFEDNMSWENHGQFGWHIDHIKPIASFKFTSYKDKKFKECWSLENLQPLWWKENLKKSNKTS